MTVYDHAWAHQIRKELRPDRDLPDEVNDWRAANYRFISRGANRLIKGRKQAAKYGLPYLWSSLWLVKIDPYGNRFPYGLASVRQVTNAGVNAIVDGFQNTFELETFKYHGIGTNNTAENATDTALNTELTTQYDPDSTRATGTLTEGASANIFKTVGENFVDASVTIVEHGIFTQAATGGGTLLDRSVFTGIVMTSGDSLESTYELTVVAGS